MKKNNIYIVLIVLVLSALLAYFSYPLVTGIVDNRRREETKQSSSSASDIPDGELVVIMSAEKATELLSLAAEMENISVSDISVSFGEGQIILDGVASTEALMPQELLKKYPNLWLIKQFIPEYARLGVSFTPSVENGELKITPESISVEEIKLPLGFVPVEIRDALCEMIVGEYIPWGFKLRSVLVENGRIIVAMD